MKLTAYLSSFASAGGNQSPHSMLMLLLTLDKQEFESLRAEFNSHFKAVHKKCIEATPANEEFWAEFAALNLPKRVLTVCKQTRKQLSKVETPQ